jgi:hypothetical protein
VCDFDEFRKKAEGALAMASRSTKPEDKVLWLQVAAEWIRLAQDSDPDAGLASTN